MDILKRSRIKKHLLDIMDRIDYDPAITVIGTVIRITGMKIEAAGIMVPVGTVCRIMMSAKKSVNAEVIGFAETTTYLMAMEDMDGIKQGTPVIPLAGAHRVRVSMSLLGRVIDAAGYPIDQGGPIETQEYYSLSSLPVNPLTRKRITEPLDTGIRAINALMTVGKGQRIGIFAGSGVGKSILLGMMTRYTRADVVVVGLIGERGREVKEFIEESLGEHGIAKSVVVASPADTSPLMRVNGAALATTIAEFYRDKGFDVLLILDSLTRYAQAQREISISVGEMPATKGFAPSVFAKMARLVERSGNGTNGQGSITAFYTVLVEGDDHNDPIADHTRSLLDGHIVLSRQLADAGHYPAIDVEKSISRVMPAVVSDQQLTASLRFKKLYSAFTRHHELINVGMYQHGTDKTVDESIELRDRMENFLRQGNNEPAGLTESIHDLNVLFSDDKK